MQKYFVPQAQIEYPAVTVGGDDAHHMVKVMRFQPGDQVIVSDGVANDYLVRLVSVGASQVEGQIVERLERLREPIPQVWLAQALPKSDKLEWIIQKGTEIGAVRFIPFRSKRTIVQLDDSKKLSKRLDRWTKIAKEAAEQSHRSIIPEISAPIDWKHLLQMRGEVDLALIAYENENSLQITDVIKQWISDKGWQRSTEAYQPTIIVCIGPEGGFDPQEIVQATEQGWVVAGLGPRILRTETAGMVALTAIQLLFGEMGG